MLKTTKIDGGIYLLEFYAKESFSISAKKFVDIIFPAGWYYYVGSAQKNLIARLKRHIRKNKTIHWHIDYLSSLSSILVTNIMVFENHMKEYECRINNELKNLFSTEFFVKGFGNSDCHLCVSHLSYSKTSIMKKIFQHYQQATSVNSPTKFNNVDFILHK